MALQQVDLSEERNAFLSQEVESGRYGDASQVVGAALDLLRNVSEGEKLRALQAAIDEGDASGIAEDGVFERVLHRLEDRAAA